MTSYIIGGVLAIIALLSLIITGQKSKLKKLQDNLEVAREVVKAEKAKAEKAEKVTEIVVEHVKEDKEVDYEKEAIEIAEEADSIIDSINDALASAGRLRQ